METASAFLNQTLVAKQCQLCWNDTPAGKGVSFPSTYSGRKTISASITSYCGRQQCQQPHYTRWQHKLHYILSEFHYHSCKCTILHTYIYLYIYIGEHHTMTVFIYHHTLERSYLSHTGSVCIYFCYNTLAVYICNTLAVCVYANTLAVYTVHLSLTASVFISSLFGSINKSQCSCIRNHI